MEILRDDETDYVKVTLRGRLDELATHETEQFFIDLLDEDTHRILLDLSGVEYISSSGLRILLMVLRALKQREGQLKLCGLSPFVAEVFDISNFRSLFDVYPDADSARTTFTTTG